MNMTIGSLGLHSGQADAAAIQQLGTMFPFDPLGIVGQIEAISQVYFLINKLHSFNQIHKLLFIF